jgi:hypothetical protein
MDDRVTRVREMRDVELENFASTGSMILAVRAVKGVDSRPGDLVN